MKSTMTLSQQETRASKRMVSKAQRKQVNVKAKPEGQARARFASITGLCSGWFA